MINELNKTDTTIVSGINVLMTPTDTTKNTDKTHNKQKLTISERELNNVINTLNSMPIISDNLRFSYASEEHQLLVQIRDKQTDELIRQYPSEEFLRSIRYYSENIGILFDKKV